MKARMIMLRGTECDRLSSTWPTRGPSGAHRGVPGRQYKRRAGHGDAASQDSQLKEVSADMRGISETADAVCRPCVRPATSSSEQQAVPGNPQQQQAPTTPSKLRAAQSFIRQYGIGAFFSYITFSNIVSVFMLSSAWILFTKTTGTTPLAPGQWPRFLVFYAGAYAMQHVARPLKLAIGLAATPVGTAAVDGAAKLLGISKNAALVVLLVLEAVMLLLCLACAALYASTTASPVSMS